MSVQEPAASASASSSASPSVSASATSELQSSLSKLSIGEPSSIKDIARPTTTQKQTIKSKHKPKKAVAESWEDEVESSENEEQQQPQSRKQQPCDSEIQSPLSPSIGVSAEGPLDPPPTPISPQVSDPWGPGPSVYGCSSSSPSSTPRSPARRPEKQTAVAGRMIAGALGIRAPKRTPEQRAYDRSVKEQEIRRRNREKEEAAKAKEEEEKAKAAIWED
ncbi:hypothetical protein PHISCL_01292 [Aspergillus sclerotialis]|uniref:Uncharacterized protein n=1 Tax=Aspergillus sclerotialis TaxID=2070753 RepID=A0A3A3A8V3_9EURO|nr:hypothetical protein PHISCL_01292 [Aspergillus sclerotialis]